MNEFITQENKETLEAELLVLRGPRQKEIIAAVEYAKSLGDLSENAEYHQAREEQAKLQERIAQIEHMLKYATVIKKTVNNGVVQIGSTVTIQKHGEENTRVFSIVGSEETDMLAGKISYKSPIGTALMSKRTGDTVSVMTPKGTIEYEIKNVQ
ncbi:MAG: transcription elongation factor GreA [bacterium]